jgi:hypothetical protein
MENHGVEGYADLARDPTTNSIVNINRSEYEQYVYRRKTKTEENQKVQTIEEEVANIKTDLNEIKSLLREFINGSK